MSVKYKIIKKPAVGVPIAGSVQKTQSGSKKRKPKPPTIRQQNVHTLLVANGGKMSKAKILRAAGYSRAIQRNPDRIFTSDYIAPAVDEIIKRLEYERDEILKLMEKKRKGAGYVALSMTLKGVTHDIQLLAGQPTDRFKNEMDDEDRRKLDEVLSLHREDNAAA